jgi:gentisate 1,2-dioxygenase
MDPTAAERPDADLIRTLEGAHYHPLWDRYKRITPIAPRRRDEPMHWRWRDFEPLAARAAKEVPIEDVERRAIICVNPAFAGETVTTSNLIAAFTILEPGDHAVPHRHTAAAIRFATRAVGAVTIVNGQRCEMMPGDLVLTPPMCWHGHVNESDHRTYWFDAANMPLICGLEASFFEPGRRDDAEFWSVGAGGARQYRYPGEETRAQLARLPAGADDAKWFRYTNAAGGPVMPTLDCYAARLARGTATRPTRTTWNTVVLVVSGAGRSTVGDRTFDWSQHDVFTVPHWTWASHEARGGDADLFLVTDRSVYEALDLARTEMQ